MRIYDIKNLGYDTADESEYFRVAATPQELTYLRLCVYEQLYNSFLDPEDQDILQNLYDQLCKVSPETDEDDTE